MFLREIGCASRGMTRKCNCVPAVVGSGWIGIGGGYAAIGAGWRGCLPAATAALPAGWLGFVACGNSGQYTSKPRVAAFGSYVSMGIGRPADGGSGHADAAEQLRSHRLEA